jgi:pimeloyl-ACP methyl ester carboxylesterase
VYALHFGQSPKRLYGAYDPALTGPGLDAVLVCAPWGPEWLPAHRTLRTMARRLADRGLHVMRFDYFGSGDSFGEETDLSLPSMLDDIEQGVEECLALAGADRVWLVGLRLGASLAALAAPTIPEVEGVVLWDPILNGASYLEEIEARANVLDGEVWDIGGHLLSAPMRDELADLRLDSARDLTRVKLLLQHEGDETLDLGPIVRRYSGPKPWVQEGEFGSAPLPTEVLDHVDELLSR